MNTIDTDIKSSDKQETIEALIGCIPLLEKIADRFEILEHLPEPQRIAFITAAGKISRPDPEEIKKRRKEKNRQKRRAIVEKERRLRAATGIRRAREASVFTAPQQISHTGREDGHEDREQSLKTPLNCYVCKTEFTKLHHYYDTMRIPCTWYRNNDGVL